MVEKNGTNQQPAGYDKTDVNITKIVGYTFTIIIVLIAIVVFLYEVFVFSKEQAVYDLVLRPESKMLRELRAREDQQLNSYKVLDEEEDIYQIPIDQAIKIISNEEYQKRLNEVKTP